MCILLSLHFMFLFRHFWYCRLAFLLCNDIPTFVNVRVLFFGLQKKCSLWCAVCYYSINLKHQHRSNRYNNNTKRKESQMQSNSVPKRKMKRKKKKIQNRAIHRFHLIFIIHSGNQCLSKRLATKNKRKKNDIRTQQANT